MAKKLTTEYLQGLLNKKVVLKVYNQPYIIDTLLSFTDVTVMLERSGEIKIKDLYNFNEYKYLK